MSTSTLARETLAQLIEEAREATGMTAEAAAAEGGINATTLRRWERAETGVKAKDVAFLADLYRVSTEEKTLWTALAFKAKDKNLFESTAKVPPNLRVLVAAEARARRLRILELEHVPGLLQTRAYHQAIQAAALPVDPKIASEFREVRSQRQEAVFGEGASRRRRSIEFIIGLAAMTYLKAWPEVEAEQIDRMRQVNAMPNASVRVITSAHAAMMGSFTHLEPPSGSSAKPLVCLESADGVRNADDPVVVSDFSRMFDHVRDHQSVTIEEYMK